MDRRANVIFLLFFLVLVLIITGNYIHIFSTKRGIDYENKDTYSKNKGTNVAILIEVDKKQLHVVDKENEKIIKTYPVATGKPDTPTPLGSFKIVEKGHWGEGFGSRWMGLNVPWGKYGIHGTNKPGSIGYNASAGCIRMRNKDVEEVYSMVKHDTTVVIINGSYGPFGNGFRNLRPGDRGADVAEVQKRLLQKGYYNGSIDGIYGEGMKYSLLKYLKDNNMILSDTIGYEIYEKLGIILMD
ncbi:L,D-transpeptidase family protein [Tissierella sp. MSJ-40]|uniref:L,D-transpeptidase family protein n=1 Tax=Tissierella simiarum TaxID=2841534 RepID=A0ABS6E6U5_9FIRM|nr:L,D-transpeptidase family protein [Tissierella simiarum]MBU5438566.1 L,D-transpeptidase family protein [Tissierella simiarum]